MVDRDCDRCCGVVFLYEGLKAGASAVSERYILVESPKNLRLKFRFLLIVRRLVIIPR